MYGPWVMELIIKPWYMILLEDIINAFYMFQLISLTTWCIEVYYQYSATIVTLISISLYGEFRNIYDNLHKLKEMAYYQWKVEVKRRDGNGNTTMKEVDSGDLVPGDVIIVPEGRKMPCDAIMLNGESIMNEAMLTGESIPAVKIALPNSDTLLTSFSIENKEQVIF